MKKLRIAQLAPLWETIPPKKYGGIEIIVDVITKELARRGHDVTLFASGNSKTKAKLESVFPRSLFEEKVDWFHRSQNLIHAANAFRMADRFDIIHNHMGDNALFFSRITRTPMITTLHNVLPNPENSKSDEYITFDHYSKKTYFASISFDQRTHTDISLNYAGTVYNGINMKDFTFNPKPKNYFAWLGRIHYGKGMWEAVHASRETKSNLIAAGNITCESDEKYFNTVKTMIDGKKIKYIGEVGPKKKNILLGSAKALLFPIRWEEPFGLVMAEAMACGTPVIAFKRGSVPEIVKHGKTGFVVEDEKGLIEAMKNIDKIDRAQCRKHVEKHFTIERMVDAYEEVYEKIIKNK